MRIKHTNPARSAGIPLVVYIGKILQSHYTKNHIAEWRIESELLKLPNGFFPV